MILLLAVLAAICAACGASQNQATSKLRVEMQSPAVNQLELDDSLDLGALDQLDRSVNYTDEDRLIPGADFATGLPNQGVQAVDDSAKFTPAYNPGLDPGLVSPAYGIYVFNLADYDQEIQLIFGVSDPPATEGDLYFAIADFSTGRWSWTQSDGSRMLDLPDFANYISPAGHIFFAVVMTGIDPAQLDFVRIGSGFAPSGTLDSDTVLGPYPLTVNFTAEFVDTDGYLMEYQWDFNNDDTIDEVTTEPILEHVFPVPGTFTTRVHAIDNEGMEGTNFRSINVTGVLPPGPPENVQASDGTYGEQIHVTWDKPTTGSIPKGFRVERADSENGEYAVVGEMSFAFTEFSDTSVTDDSVYWYRVISTHDLIGNSVPSESDDGYRGTLNPPSNVICSKGTQPTRISISWTHPSAGATPEGYRVYRAADPDGLKTFVASVGFENFYADESVPDGQIYYYLITSTRTNFLDSDFSESGFGYVEQLVAPTDIVASDDASPTVVTVSWTHSGGGQTPQGYDIYRDTTEDGAYTNKIGFVGYVETFNDNSATDGQVYFYKVKAIRLGWDDSPLSDDFDSGYVGLSAPLGLSASDDDFASEVSVSWLPPNMGPTPDDYEVFRADSVDGVYASLGSTASLNWADDTVSIGTTYYYKAIAKKTDYTDSAYSNTDSGHAGVV